jgi:predicted transcriptional regulator
MPDVDMSEYDTFEVERVLNVIFNAGESGATRLKVMADLFISDRRAKSYIDLISRAGLVECEIDNTFYKITPEGREWLEENGR